MSQRKCWWLFFHDWEKWETIQEGDLTTKLGGHIGRYKIQQRECSKCGKVKLRSEKV